MSAATSGGKPHRSWRQRLLITFNSLCIVAALLLAAALGYANDKTTSVQRVSLGRSLATEPVSSSSPQNYLLVGTDSAVGLSPDDPAVQGRGDVGGARSDTMMILRIEPKEKKAILLAIPRDLWVPIYDAAGNQHGSQKLNSAIEYGGPAALIRTIDENFQIPIHHYVQVDWEGFKGVIEAIGGVPVYFSDPVRDRDCNEYDANGECINHTGLDITKTGCITLDPTQALGYVRSRYFQYYRDGEWHADETSDFGRSSRQELFIQQAIKRAIAKGVRNPVTLNNLINATLGSVTIDEGLTPGSLLSLGRVFQSFDPESLEKIALPTVSSTDSRGAVEDLSPDIDEAIFARFRGQTATDGATPQGTQVQVLNGSGAYNQATTVTDALEAQGFAGLAPGDSSSPGPQTVIRYRLGKEASAQLVARYLDADVTFEQADLDESMDVQVVTGTGFNAVLTTPKDPALVQGPSTTTTTTTTTTAPAPTDGSSSTTTAPGSTTTTLPGYTPTLPPGVTCG